jgi:uncharacterized cupin superfamily protein
MLQFQKRSDQELWRRNAATASAARTRNTNTNAATKTNAESITSRHTTFRRKRSMAPADQAAKERHALANCVSDNFLRLQCKSGLSRFFFSMRKVNLKDVPEQERKSPKGKFHKFVQDISIALGRESESLDLAKRHPFDLARIRIPKGKSYCPYHSHSAESELYLVISGRGSIRDRNGTTEVGAGDTFFFGPGEAHQLNNAGNEDFVYYVIADNPRGDCCYYPDSGKWAVTVEGLEEIIVKGKKADYYDGEE